MQQGDRGDEQRTNEEKAETGTIEPSLPRNVWIGIGLSGLLTATITFGMTGAWTAWYLFIFHSIKPDPIEFLVSSVLWAFVAGIAGAIFGMVVPTNWRVGVDMKLSRGVLTIISFFFFLWVFGFVFGLGILFAAAIAIYGMKLLGDMKLLRRILTVVSFFFLLIVLLAFNSFLGPVPVRGGIFSVIFGMFLIGIELCLLALLFVPLHQGAIFLDRIFAQSFARGMVVFFFVATFLVVVCLGLSYHNPIPDKGAYDPQCMYVIKVAYEEAQRRGWDDARFEVNPSECDGSSAAGSFGGVFVHRNTGIITCTLRSEQFTCEP
jgi:hypothetical protein